MRARRASLLLLSALALAACGKQQSTGDRAPAPAPPAVTAAATAHAPPPQKAAEPASDAPSKITRMNEDGSETVEEVSGDTGARNPLLAAVAGTVTAATSTAAAAPLSGPVLWQEGVNYTRLVPAQPTAVSAGQVEVLEFFWYACPHCYGIDPMVEAWKKTKPAYISFSRVPVMWNQGHRSLARLYYTLESLGKLDQLHSEVFKEIHVNGDLLVSPDGTNDAESESMQLAFVKKFGVPEDSFRTAYQSFAVETDLQKADQLVQRYRIDGVPTFVVNGKFVADVRTAGSPENLLSLIGDLAAQEHKR